MELIITEYFLYKFNISKKDQKRLKMINSFYNEGMDIKNLQKKILINIYIIMVIKQLSI